MPEKILYYFGAGASAKALPISKSVNHQVAPANHPPKIPGLAYGLKQISLEQIFESYQEQKFQIFKNKLTSEFSTLSDQANLFGDVDTYAKYLYIKSDPKFPELKKTLSQYFSMEQMFLSKMDDRYLPWLIGIMETKQFPENIKILSWNYDFQVQLAFSEFGALEEIDINDNSYVYAPSHLPYYPLLDPNPDRDSNYSLIHLNGIAGFHNSTNGNALSIFQGPNRANRISALNYLMQESIKPKIHFAWEKGFYQNELHDKVLKMINDTTIIVVVGYSFPFYNREIDKVVFGELNNSNKLKKIYYQDPVLNGEQLRAQFSLRDDLSIVHIPQTEKFHIPFEY
jgi:hypothetical protein